jgi:hypothetical protein
MMVCNPPPTLFLLPAPPRPAYNAYDAYDE